MKPCVLVLVVTMVGCTASIPPGSSPQAGQAIQQPVPRTPMPMRLQQQARAGDGGPCASWWNDPCSTCLRKCGPGGDMCVGDVPTAASIACVHAKCADDCPGDPP